MTYTPHVWSRHDKLDSTALNNLEQAVAEFSTSQVSASDATIAPIITSGTQTVAAVNSTIDAHLGGDSTNLVPTVFGKVTLPAAAEQTLFVTVRGNDANDGRSLATAKATIAAAIAALGGNPGVIQLGMGTISTAATHTPASGLTIRGAGRQLGATTITYTGTGTLFAGTPGTRTYNFKVQDVGFTGPGKTSTAVCIDLMDMSNVRFDGFAISTFGSGILHRSQVVGGAVYNTFIDGTIMSNGVGVQFTATGSNGSRWYGVKFGANTTAVDLTDSNQNSFLACQFEANGTALSLDCTAAGLSDHNSFGFCRFESNTLPWNIKSANVRDTEILWPAIFGTWNTPTDLGTRTVVQASSATYLPPPGAVRKVLTRAGSYTLTTGDDVVFFNAGSAAVTATLPAPSTVFLGRQYVLRQRGTVALTVATAGGTVDVTSIPAGGHQVYVSDGTNWYAIG